MIMTPRQAYRSSTTFDILTAFGYSDLFPHLNGDGINRLENILILEGGVHSAFDNLGFWLTPVVRLDTGMIAH